MSKLFVQHNTPVVDLDILAREAVEPGSRALKQLVAHFGQQILKPAGSDSDDAGQQLVLDREKLGSIVFNDERERKKLNSIVHPAVRRLLAWKLIKLWLTGHKLAIVDAPLLIEAGLWKFCGAIVIVYWYDIWASTPCSRTLTLGHFSSEALQVQRIRARNNVSAEEAQSRIRAQAPLSSKLAYADHVIDNSGPVADLDDQVATVARKLKRKAGWFYLVSWLVPPIGILSGALLIAWRLGFKGVGKSRRSKYATRGEQQRRKKHTAESRDEIELQPR